MLNKFSKIKNFNLTNQTTFLICAAIFLLSIYIRSLQDIGADTGFYLVIGKKIALGQRYYYDFFESNFPISFYIYALQYHLSQWLHINEIIMSEIFVNLFAVLSLFWSHQILKKSFLAQENKIYPHLLLISFCIGFFLRIEALAIGEFGTKTSFLLILLMPYISYCFVDNKSLNKKNLVYRGILMGLIPCLKPHYLIIILFIEFYKFLQDRSIKFFFELDKLIMAMIGILYIDLMLKFTPEFFEFMITMWSKFYSGFDDAQEFIDNLIKILSHKIFFFALLTPVFVYLKPNKNNKIFIIFFIAFSTLLLLENIGTIDQEVIFYFFITAFLVKISYDLLSTQYSSFLQNKFISLTFLFIPFFDPENFYSAFFGVLTTWPLLIAALFTFFYYRYKKIILENKKLHFAAYIALSAATILALRYLDIKSAYLFCMICFIYFAFLYEFSYKKQNHKCSPLLLSILFLLISFFSYHYFKTIKSGILRDNYFSSPKTITDKFNSQIKLYAPKQNDTFLVFSYWIAHQFPLTNYLDREYKFKYAAISLYDKEVQGPKNKNKTIFSIKDNERGFVYNYLLDSVKEQIRDKNLKILFVNSMHQVYSEKACGSALLEYLFQDKEFKKIFFENFTFKNRIIEYKKHKEKPKRLFKIKDKFDTLEKSETYIDYEFEVYIRK